MKTDLRFGIIGNTRKEKITEHFRRMLHFLESHAIAVRVESTLADFARANGYPELNAALVASRDEVFKFSDIVIVFGGDGTMLMASQFAIRYEKPLLGINIGKLGFLADVSANEMLSALDRIAAGNYTVEERMTIEGRSPVLEQSLIALNDIVISKSGSARTISMRAFVDDEYVATYHADGIIVSTPTGSTAYCLATGGPIVAPTTDAVIIIPMAPHTLTARPIIVPDSTVIRIETKIDEGEVLIVTDGQLSATTDTAFTITISRGTTPVQLIKRKESSYFETLRTKLMWGKDSRLDEQRIPPKE